MISGCSVAMIPISVDRTPFRMNRPLLGIEDHTPFKVKKTAHRVWTVREGDKLESVAYPTI